MYHACSPFHTPGRPLIVTPVVIPRDQHSLSRANISPNALKVLYRLKSAGFQAHLVGGGVRDLLLGREPKDFDVATDARPEQVREVFRNCRLIGRRFRLAHVHFGREIIEVATFRGLGGNDAEGDGYRGRTGIYELIEIDDQLRMLIYEDASEQQMLEYARRSYPGIEADGRRRILAGENSLTEVLRLEGIDGAAWDHAEVAAELIATGVAKADVEVERDEDGGLQVGPGDHRRHAGRRVIEPERPRDVKRKARDLARQFSSLEAMRNAVEAATDGGPDSDAYRDLVNIDGLGPAVIEALTRRLDHPNALAREHVGWALARQRAGAR